MYFLFDVQSRLKDDAQTRLRELLSSVTGDGHELSLEESVDKISQLYGEPSLNRHYAEKPNEYNQTARWLHCEDPIRFPIDFLFLFCFPADDLTVAVDDTNQCVALAFCTDQMRVLWREFPELLTIESSSYIESLELANIVHFLVADAMGELRPVMFAVLLKSESNLYEWLLNEFVR